jgi:hypothetical protein
MDHAMNEPDGIYWDSETRELRGVRGGLGKLIEPEKWNGGFYTLEIEKLPPPLLLYRSWMVFATTMEGYRGRTIPDVRR